MQATFNCANRIFSSSISALKHSKRLSYCENEDDIGLI